MVMCAADVEPGYLVSSAWDSQGLLLPHGGILKCLLCRSLHRWQCVCQTFGLGTESQAVREEEIRVNRSSKSDDDDKHVVILMICEIVSRK